MIDIQSDSAPWEDRFMKKIISIFFVLLCILCLSVTSFGRTELLGLLLKNYDAQLYTEESYNQYQKAVNQAIAVQENSQATQEEINAAKNQLIEAESKLVSILDREALLSYIDTIDAVLNNTSRNFSTETEQALIDAKENFQSLYQNDKLNDIKLRNAARKYNIVIKAANNTGEVERFSEKNAEDGVILPKNIISSSQGLSKLTQMRLTIVLIGAGLFVLGLAVLIVYLKPPAFLR